MLVSSFCASRPRDATRRMSATELMRRSSVAAATPSQARSNCSVAASLQPSTQVELVVSTPSRPSSRFCWHHFEEGRGGTSRRDASCAQHQLRRSSTSSVVAAEGGDGTVSRDDERSTGARLFNFFQDDHAKCHHSSLSSNLPDERAGCHSPCEIFFPFSRIELAPHARRRAVPMTESECGYRYSVRMTK